MFSLTYHNNSRHSYTTWLSNDGACIYNEHKTGVPNADLNLQLCVHMLSHHAVQDSTRTILPTPGIYFVTCCMLQEGTVFQTRRQTGDRRDPSTSESLVFTLDCHLCLHVLLHPLSLMTAPPPPHSLHAGQPACVSQSLQD